jgi:dTDP-glucose 4,6-dehydratase
VSNETKARKIQRIVVTGGAGFIGSNFTRWMLAREPQVSLVVLDKLTYAGNLANLADLSQDPRYEFIEGDIADAHVVDRAAAGAEAIVNFAAESHVDRSIDKPEEFIRTDIVGTHVLLEAALRHRHKVFLQISTDEVYGDVPSGSSTEGAPLSPRSPYSASKAGADLMVLAYGTTYGLPVAITRSSNNFGPYQYPEKVIPLFVTNALDDQPLPLYGDGLQVRDWLYVTDNCAAIERVLIQGRAGEIYNVGAGTEMTNLELTKMILAHLGKPSDLVRLVPDRPGHDRRYSVDTTKIKSLGWQPAHAFPEAIADTIEWYRAHSDWWRPLKTGEYLDYYRRQYAERLAAGRSLE